MVQLKHHCSVVWGTACVGLPAKPCPGVIISNSQLSVFRQNTYFGEVCASISFLRAYARAVYTLA